MKSCDQGALEVSTIQAAPAPTAAPTIAPTVAPTAAPGAPTATARPPTATPRPAPQTDRVGFPEDYQTKFKFFFVTDRIETKQIRVQCGNEVAATVKPGEAFPYGSDLIFESWVPKEDAFGVPVLDSKGRMIRERWTTIFAMRKEIGMSDLGFYPINAQRIGFVAVKTGTAVKFTNNDDTGILHTVVAKDGSFTSPALKAGESLSFTFSKAGVSDFFCTLHPEQMNGRVDVRD